MESVTHCITKGIKYENLSHMLSNSPKSSLDFFFKKIIPSEKHTLASYPCIESKHFFFFKKHLSSLQIQHKVIIKLQCSLMWNCHITISLGKSNFKVKSIN